MSRTQGTIARAVCAAVALGAALCAVRPAAAQSYPDRPVKLLIPLAAASAVDVAARLIAERTSERLGQRFYVENQAGAAGLIGMRAGARAAADGYTVIVANDSVLTMLPNMKADAGYDPIKDFTPVIQLVGIPLGLIANPAFAAGSVGDLIALARAKPREINYASGGIGSPQHIAMELLARTANLMLTHVPYRGATAAVSEIVAGHVPVGFTGMSSVMPLLAESRIRLLATSGAARLAQVPRAPAVAETVPGFEFVPWCALLLPAQAPADIVAQLNAAAAASLREPAVQARLTELGFEVVGGTPERLGDFMRREHARMGDLIRTANIHE
ncbi:MAG: tripartite tricarboxylate transporter substrate binding protein [Hyphomicrobiales bacterium]|nr:tripartite tricarboxylate transporter substrate binding protein [Hyphomicrobiales bacterium]